MLFTNDNINYTYFEFAVRAVTWGWGSSHQLTWPILNQSPLTLLRLLEAEKHEEDSIQRRFMQRTCEQVLKWNKFFAWGRSIQINLTHVSKTLLLLLKVVISASFLCYKWYLSLIRWTVLGRVRQSKDVSVSLLTKRVEGEANWQDLQLYPPFVLIALLSARCTRIGCSHLLLRSAQDLLVHAAM